MSQKFIITSALPYANGPLHFGHIAGAYLPADCFARFQRLQGADVLYISGSDEHGVAITLSAEQAKRSPKEHVDLYHEMNKALFEKLEFSFDHFGRTTWPGHIETTLEFFDSLKNRGMIEEKEEQHLYSEVEKRFLADRYVVGTCPNCGYDKARGDECQKCAHSYEATDLKNPKSKLTGSPLILKPSKHLYLRFDKFKDQLNQWIETKNFKENVIHFAMQYIKDLKPRAITRDSDWGIKVPGYEGKVFYVWFDAPIGYVSIAKEWAEMKKEPDLWEKYWFDPECQLIHFIGKDNIPFHAVFFPAMLMGQKRPYILPSDVPANEFYLLEGRQFSKSDQWTIDLEEFFSLYTADQARFAIAASAPETSDSEFSYKEFQMHCNAELLGKLGNFVNRVLVFLKNQCNHQIPSCKMPDEAFREKMELLVELARSSFEKFQLRKASQVLMELAQLGNVYFDHKKPWVLAKDPSKKELLASILADCVECIKNLALISNPIIPNTSSKIWKMLGMKEEITSFTWKEIQKELSLENKTLGPLEILFRRVEDEEIEAQVKKLGAPMDQAIFEPLKSSIEFDDFLKLDLRAAQIIEAVKVPKSKKLLQLTVDLGFEKRTVMSGIAQNYQPEELIGKKVILVANLKPAKIMGVESQGMILASSFENALELPELEQIAPGSVIS